MQVFEKKYVNSLSEKLILGKEKLFSYKRLLKSRDVILNFIQNYCGLSIPMN